MGIDCGETFIELVLADELHTIILAYIAGRKRSNLPFRRAGAVVLRNVKGPGALGGLGN